MLMKKLKRIQAVLLAVLIMLATFTSCAATDKTSHVIQLPEEATQTSFTDVQNHWAKDAIYYVVDEGLFTGTSDTTFSPNQTVTRTMFATVLARMADTDTDDVTISNGSGNLTREQMAKLLYKYIDSIGLTVETATDSTNTTANEITYTDESEISSDAKTAVDTVTALGLMSGKNDGSFNPEGTTTRAEAASVIARLCRLIDSVTTSDTFVSKVMGKTDSIDQYTNYKKSDYQAITLKGSSISFKGTGASVDGNIITITKAGTYVISGTLSDGMIIVDCDDEDKVSLVLNNADITSSEGSPILVKNAKDTTLSLPSGTENTLTDGTKHSYDEDASGVLFSADDLLINGSGSLSIESNYKDGISGNDDIQITEAMVNITSADDGIVANDSISVNGANITIDAACDGLKTTTPKDIEKGFIAVNNSNIKVKSGTDGFQAKTLLAINDSKTTIKTTSSEKSAKALKADSGIVILNGSFVIDSNDDALHSNGIIRIEGGDFSISSGDDAFHAGTSLSVQNGTITVKKCYEGLESRVIDISGGTIDLTASDDGINVSGGTDSGTIGAQGPGQSESSTNSSYKLTISGGDIKVNADGDGIDANGSAYDVRRNRAGLRTYQ